MCKYTDPYYLSPISIFILTKILDGMPEPYKIASKVFKNVDLLFN